MKAQSNNKSFSNFHSLSAKETIDIITSSMSIMDQDIVNKAIGVITEVVTKTVEPQDFEKDHQTVTMAITRHNTSKIILSKDKSGIDPAASMKIFAAFLSIIITQHANNYQEKN